MVIRNGLGQWDGTGSKAFPFRGGAGEGNDLPDDFFPIFFPTPLTNGRKMGMIPLVSYGNCDDQEEYALPPAQESCRSVRGSGGAERKITWELAARTFSTARRLTADIPLPA